MNYYLQNQKKLTISNILILISLFFTLLTTTYSNFIIFWMNEKFLNSWIYHIFIIQFFTYSFIHAWILHFVSNSLFLYIFWNLVEQLLWKRKFIIFFVFTTIFNWVMLIWLSNWNTVGISGFAMALLTYYTLKLKERNNNEYKWWITALILNIIVWLHPWVSLIWHLFWAIAWLIFYLFNKNYFKKVLIKEY